MKTKHIFLLLMASVLLSSCCIFCGPGRYHGGGYHGGWHHGGYYRR